MPTRVRNPVLFPSFVAQHSICVDETDDRTLAEQFPTIRLPPALENAVHKRRLEFVAGRHCAREALRECAPELVDVPIESGEHREPRWPPGIVGSITHTAGYVSAAVARIADARSLGLDAELWMKPKLAAEIRDRIASPDEVDALVRDAGLPFPSALTVLFSAKETLFKCLFSDVRRYFDFRDVNVGCVDAAGGVLAARLLVTLTPAFQKERVLSVRFEYDERLVRTGMLLPV